MPFLLAEILNFQGSTHHIGVGSFSQSEMKLEKLFRIAEVLDVTPNKLLPGEAKTASNKFFEFEHMMKQLSEADQELIFNMVMPCMKRLLPNT